ncbi:MAG: hypothetical protein DRJ29_17920 [Bacteroidetes bacterium]|nr:MAG: hypothetical protein DRJ29_17920 [Bacteroidota bacterium]
MAVSADGGDKWQNFRVSDANFQPKPIPMPESLNWSQNYQGDYIGIAAHNNVAYLVWADDRTGNYQAWMSKVTFGTPVSVDKPHKTDAPQGYSLKQNYPNPFKHISTIHYSIPVAGHVSLKVFDTTGKEIRILVNEVKPAGFYEAAFDASHESSGLYLYQLQVDDVYSETKEMILRK